MKPCWLAGQFVSDPMQFSDLVKKGLELLLVDVVQPSRAAPRARATRVRSAGRPRSSASVDGVSSS
jgi:hypothetical protein